MTGNEAGAEALKDVNLKIAHNRVTAFIGPSGCGKTTSLRILAGFENATTGNVYIDEHRVNDIPPQRRNTAMVFQSYGLFPHMTVLENVELMLRLNGERNAKSRARARELLDLASRLKAMVDRFIVN